MSNEFRVLLGLGQKFLTELKQNKSIAKNKFTGFNYYMRIGNIFNCKPLHNIKVKIQKTLGTKTEPEPKKRKITNLTNELTKIHYNGCEFDTFFKENPHLSRTVGSLPQKWGRKVGKSKQKREAIDKLFSDFARKFHATNPISTNTKEMEEGLSAILETPVTIKPLGSGAWGQTYKINADSQDYVLKVFYNSSPTGYGSRSNKHCTGNFNELASAIYSSKHAADHFVTFYMGRFGEKQDGYMLTKFLHPQKNNEKIFNDMTESYESNFVFQHIFANLYVPTPEAIM